MFCVDVGVVAGGVADAVVVVNDSNNNVLGPSRARCNNNKKKRCLKERPSNSRVSTRRREGGSRGNDYRKASVPRVTDTPSGSVIQAPSRQNGSSSYRLTLHMPTAINPAVTCATHSRPQLVASASMPPLRSGHPHSGSSDPPLWQRRNGRAQGGSRDETAGHHTVCPGSSPG